AATKNGAIASRGLAEFGTVEAGKRADLLVLRADPLADIHNIRKISQLIKDGKLIDRTTLPQKRVLSQAAAGRRRPLSMIRRGTPAVVLLLLSASAAAQPLSPRNANYTIEARLAPASRTITATETIVWRNITETTTAELQ